MTKLTKEQLERHRKDPVVLRTQDLLDTIDALEREREKANSRITELMVERKTAELQVAGMRLACSEHIPMTLPADADDPGWLISRGACSCKKVVADGVTPWNKLWREHILAIPDEAADRAIADIEAREFDAGIRVAIQEINPTMRTEHPALDEFRSALKADRLRERLEEAKIWDRTYSDSWGQRRVAELTAQLASQDRK
jgi:hypothetical protein